MKIVLLAIGRRHDADLAAAITDYTARLGRYAPVEWRLLDPAHARARGSMEAVKTKHLETEALLAELRPDDIAVLLDERGTTWTSPQVAEFLDRTSQHSIARIVFIIGGAYGVNDALRSRAQYVWSLSSLTFPHQLVRLILAEQLYRACTIMRGEPYHHQ